MLNLLTKTLSSFTSGWTTKLLLTICAILAGLAISAFIGLKHYQKSYDENLKQKAQIEAQFHQTHIILEKQNLAIKKANEDLEKYQGEIKKIKKENAKKFAELEKRQIQTCNDLANGLVDMLKTYSSDSSALSSQNASQNPSQNASED
ncbi:hypothetical protein [Helicobacter sp. T3_23-1056]